jgi:phenylalanyl-tRNA synthetase beta chain
MRLLASWLRDFVDVSAAPEEIAERLSLRGFEVAGIEPVSAQASPPWARSASAGSADAVIDFEVTANRPDCLSVVGLAREVATLYDMPVAQPPALQAPASTPGLAHTGQADRVNVSIEDPDLCPRYAAAVADLTANASSPAWLTARLTAAGIRPISPVVDVTNYVLLEIGQPMHAFDLASLAGGEIRVRRARAGERLTTLDGVERTLDAEMLVIADATRAQAVAGVMGGAASEVSAATGGVVFESAYFKPASVRRTSKRLGLKTEASTRFERGADVSAATVAIERALALMEMIGAGRRSGTVVDRYPAPRMALRLHLRRTRLAMVLGANVPDAEVERILRRLGLTVAAAGDGWDIVAPTFRVDLLREIDLIEEVGRHHGFDRLEATFPVQTAAAPPPDPRIARDRLVRHVLTAAGLSEAVTFGFVEARAAAHFPGADRAATVAIANPLSAKFDTLRPSLLPGLVDSVAHNRRHGRRDVGLFEIGARFSTAGESRGVGIAWTGARSEHWSSGAPAVDFFDVKGLVERLAEALGVAIAFERCTVPFLSPGTAATLLIGGSAAGTIGQVAPGIVEERGMPRHDELFVAEFDLDRAWAARTTAAEAIAALPRYPFVVRDLSIVVEDALPAEIIRGTILSAAAGSAAPLAGVRVFDRYQGKGVPEGTVSLSVRLTFQALDRTLTDAEVQDSVDNILGALMNHHQAVQR